MTRLTDEQLSELIKHFEIVSITWGEDAAHLSTRTHEALQELQALRAKPIALVPSEEDLFSWSNEFKKLGGQWPNHGATYDWLRSRIKPITSDQCKQIREALEEYNGKGEWVSTSAAEEALALMDEIEGKK